MITSSEFVSKAKLYQKLTTSYVWGTFGWPITTSNITRAINAYPSSNAKRKSTLEALAGKDAWMFDCVGYIKALLWGFKATSGSYGGATYASNGVPDINADTMINKCSGISSDFSTIVPGEVVWLTGHIGIYIGDGKVVECTPAWKNGVQITACLNIAPISGLNGRKWTKHGKLPYVTYESNTSSTSGRFNKVVTTELKDGNLYEIPLDDIAYIGYFPSANLNKGKGELVTNAYNRILYGKKKADFIFNCELFDSKMEPVSAITDDGKIHLEREYFGYGFVNNQKPVFSYKNNVNAPDYVGAYPLLVKDGKKFFTSDPAGLGGSRARTTMALKDDKLAVAFVSGSGCTLTSLAETFIGMGYDSACNFDGGGSTQAIAPKKNVISTRAVRGFVAIWLKSSGNAVGQTITYNTGSTATSNFQTSAKNGVTYYVNVKASSCLNLRASYSTSSAIKKQLARGAKVIWYGYSQIEGGTEWKRVQASDGTEGWVVASYLSKSSV